MTCLELWLLLYTRVLLSQAWILILIILHCFLVWRLSYLSFLVIPHMLFFLCLMPSLDFELVGSSSGEITLWDVGSREKLVSKPFKPWDMASCTLQFQVNITAFCIICSESAHAWVSIFLFRPLSLEHLLIFVCFTTLYSIVRLLKRIKCMLGILWLCISLGYVLLWLNKPFYGD